MLDTARELLHTVLFNPSSSAEFWVSAILSAVAFVMTLNGIGSALDIPLAETGRSVVVLVVTVSATLLILAAIALKFSPDGWVLVAAAGLVVLVVAVPAVCLVQRGSYLNGLFAMLLSLVALVLVALAVHTVFGAIGQGGKSVGKELERKQRIERALGAE